MRFKDRYKMLDNNNRIILRNTVAAFVVKGGSLCISLVTTPAFVRYFNNNAILGVWYTLLSVLIWFLNFDLGIGNGIRNNLVEDFASNDYESAQRTISSGLLSNGIVTIILSLIGVVIISNVELNSFLNVEAEILSSEVLLTSAIIVFFGIMCRFFLTCISSVFYALQMSSINNFLGLCVSLLQLIFVIAVKPAHPEQGLLILAIAYSITSNVPVLVAGIIIFATKLRRCRPSIKYVDRNHIQRVMGIGTVFFVCQITYMLLMNTNEFLVSNLFGPQYTTEYTFYYKLTSLISMVVSLALTPIWSVVTKAIAEKNYAWIKSLYTKLQYVGLTAVIVQFAFILIQQFVMDFWLGSASIKINYFTAVAFACFGSVFIYCSILSTIVCGMARMRLQMICYTVGVIVKFGVVYALAPVVNDWTIVVWSNVLVLMPYCIMQHADLTRLFRKMGQ